MKKILLCYFDYNNSHYTPLDLACVKTIVEKKYSTANLEIIKLKAIKSKEEFQKEAYYLASFDANEIYFFLDNILWSMMFALKGVSQIARELKQLHPHIKTGIQSYKIKERDISRIFNDFPEIDVLLRGEPEIPFLQYFESQSWEIVEGVSVRLESGIIQTKPNGKLIQNIDDIPSPYLTGTLDKFIAESSSRCFFMCTSRGCPCRCHYCFRSVKYSRVRTHSIERVIAEIDFLRNKKAAQIFMLDDCFVVSQSRFFTLVEAFQEAFPKNVKTPRIRIMSRPEFLNEEIIEALPKMNIEGVQLGLQSIHPDTQFLMGRGCSIERFGELVNLLQIQNIKVHLDIIIGLPHDDLIHCKKTIDLAIKFRPNSLQIKQLYQNPNTLFDIYPEKYGIKVASNKHLYDVPFVKSTNTFSNEDIQEASKYANSFRNNVPIIMKLITQFHHFSDFNDHGHNEK